MNRADRWLHLKREHLRMWPEHRSGEVLGAALAGVEALSAARVLTGERASAWRRLLVNAHAPDAAAPSELQGPAEELLDAMLAQVPQDAADLDPRQERFEGALELLGAIGLADGREWDARRRRRLGWPTAEEERAEEQGFGLGGHQVDLLASIPGADEWRGGRRLLLVLRFADGVSFHLESESCDPDFDSFDDWPVWQLTDDLGTRYETVASGGGAGRETVDFGIGPPSDARWLELSLAGEPGTRFRVGL